MFWNKKKEESNVNERFSEMYTKLDFMTLRNERDMYKEQNDQKQKRIEEMKAVFAGNGEYYGRFQEKWQEDRQHLNDTRLHLKLEQEAYAKLYAKNRDLESELYILKREIEILKGEVK